MSPSVLPPKPKLDKFWHYFEDLEDPRDQGRNHTYSLRNILLCSIVGMAAGCRSFQAIADFADDQFSELAPFLDPMKVSPSRDTFRRVFEALNPEVFERCFRQWTQADAPLIPDEVIAIDGKTLRGSRSEHHAAIHMVHAWATTRGLVLGQVRTADHSNEITAIPVLLAALQLDGAIITADAMGCQKKIAAQIVAQRGQYVLAVKDNHKTMHTEIREYFTALIDDKTLQDPTLSFHETADKGHGRLEIRRCWATTNVGWFTDRAQWAQLAAFVCVESERTVKGKTSTERRHFITSLASKNAEELLDITRRHWQVENNLHWTLDVVFGEDRAQITDHVAALNIAVVRRIAMNALRAHPDFASKRIKSSPVRAQRATAHHMAFRAILLKSITSNA